MRRRVHSIALGTLLSVTGWSAPPVTQGLVLHLESDAGLVVDGSGRVTRWNDQSPSDNDLFGSGDPAVLAAATPSGRPAVALDTSDDKLERVHATHALRGLPTGNRDRTMLLVARYHDTTWWSGVAYGSGARNRAYGLMIKHPSGELALQGWGGGNDLVSTTVGLNAGWLLQAGRLQQGNATLSKDGRPIASFTHTYQTVAERLVLGEEIAGLGHVAMDVAALLLYDRAITPAEQQSVEQYLRAKYLEPTASNVAPVVTITAPADGSTSAPGSGVRLAGTAADQEDGPLDAALEWTSDRDGPLGRGATVQAGSLSAGGHRITATVVDSRGATGRSEITHTVTAAPPSGETIVFFGDGQLRGVRPWSAENGYSDPNGTFTVVDGLLRIRGPEPYAALMTDQNFGNYVLRLEYRWGEGTFGKRAGKARDGGLLLHSRGPDGGWRGRLMAAIEVQIMEGSTGDIIVLPDTVSPPGTAPMRVTSQVGRVSCRSDTWNCRGGYRWKPGGSEHTFSEIGESVHWRDWDRGWVDVAGFRGAADVERPLGEWNELIVVADGDRLEVTLNGVKVNEATRVFPASGRIQLESELAEYYVRRWELRTLD